MSLQKEKLVKVATREEKINQRMLERVRESRKAEAQFEATLDPRQFQTKEKEDGRR